MAQDSGDLPNPVTDTRPWPYTEWVIGGALSGAAAAALLAFASGIRDLGAAILFFLLAPFLAGAGAVCGASAKKWGWAVIRPVAWATLGGVGLAVFSPAGWIAGGVVGGLINGIRARSARGLVRWTVVGAGYGMMGWAVVNGYLIGLMWLLD